MQLFSLADGSQLPALGLGTWKSAPGAVAAAVREALTLGYRHIDCAPIYQNEAEVGQGLSAAMAAGLVQRQDLWLTSKLWNNAHAPEQVLPALHQSLADLRTDYLDLFLIHWPVVFEPGVLFPRKASDYRPFTADALAATWAAMEECVAKGLVRHLGVCNFSAAKLEALCRNATIRPAMNQVELHPYLQQTALLDFCRQQRILVTAYSPLGSGDRPAAMKKSGEPSLLENPLILELAARHRVPPAQVLIAWGLARGTVMIPKSVNPTRLRQNLAAVELQLEASDMAAIAALDRGYRFVDGAFFTGQGSPYTLEAIWDEALADRLMLKVRNLAVDGLTIEQFTAAPGEAWALVGAIGSGIEQFGELMVQAPNTVAGLELPADLGLCSFKRQQQVFEEELRKDDTDFLNRLDPGTPARAFLTDTDRHRDLIRLFALDGVLDQGYRQLSSGQARKLCLLAEITRGATFLILENPYDGLDQASCRELDRVLPPLLARGIGLILLVNNQDDLPPWCTHLAGFEHGTLVTQGPRAVAWPAIQALFQRQQPLFRVSVADLRGRGTRRVATATTDRLVTLRRGFARYGEIEVFAGLDLQVNRGEHTLITGPNGCGKSTLLHLISGDHPLCYCNDLTLFGRKRGSGESIWELKQQMGILSPDLHRNHRVAGSALAIVLSGLFDSIGLYTRPTEAQQQQGRRWLERLGLAAKAQRPFRQMSHGEQRLLLLARALIKSPQLLLLDEPTYGLDQANRTALLDFLAAVAAEQLATILYVSHRQDEYRPFFRQEVRFVSGRNQGDKADRSGTSAIVAQRQTTAQG